MDRKGASSLPSSSKELIALWNSTSRLLGSDKLDVYFEELARILDGLPRGKPLRILEIGTQRGGNLLFLHRLVGKDGLVVGIDIHRPSGDLPHGIVFIQGDSRSKEVLAQVELLGPFDLIIEDASHIQPDVVRNVQNYSPLLLQGGSFMIEDTQYCYLWGWRRGFRGRRTVLRHLTEKIARDATLRSPTNLDSTRFDAVIRPYSVTLEKRAAVPVYRIDSASGEVSLMSKPDLIKHAKKVLFLAAETGRPRPIGQLLLLLLRLRLRIKG